MHDNTRNDARFSDISPAILKDVMSKNIIDRQKETEGKTVPADDLTSLVARSSASTLMKSDIVYLWDLRLKG